MESFLGYKQCLVNSLLFELQVAHANWQDLFIDIQARDGRVFESQYGILIYRPHLAEDFIRLFVLP